MYALALQADGKLLLGGFFTTIGVTPRNRIARLNPDGSLDTAFNPNANNNVNTLALQADGKLVLGGVFTTIGGTPRDDIARLNADGSLDTAFDPNANGGVYALALQADGKLVLGGGFTAIGGTTRNYIARLSQPEAALQSLTLGGNTVTWLRAGSSPELALPPPLLFSLGGSVFGALGPMSRIAGGWRTSGLTLPAVGQTFYLRAHGQLSSGLSNGSQGAIESTRQAYINDLIFANGFE